MLLRGDGIKRAADGGRGRKVRAAFLLGWESETLALAEGARISYQLKAGRAGKMSAEDLRLSGN